MGSFTIEDVETRLASGQYQFWPAQKSAVITEVQTFPHKKWLHIPFAGGDLDEIKAMHPTLWSFAKHMGCDGMTCGGRMGWERALRDLGWRRSYVAFVWTPDK